MGLLDLLFNGKKKREAVKHALQNGAKVIDVRTVGEYKSGHYDGAINIPLDKIATNTKKISGYNSAIVVYCASGMRSAAAARILKTNGIEAYNGKTMYNVHNLATDN
jgi:rhodanese-related sulfurtransferase